MAKLYTCKEIAEMLSVKEETVWDWVRTGKLKAHKINGRNYRVSQEQVDEMLNKKEK